MPGKPVASRGYKAHRCPTCQLPTAGCICHFTPTIRTPVRFWILMHPGEAQKPTNTARLIAAALPHTRVFLWQRTTPPAELCDLLSAPQFAPYLVFPQGNAERFERLPADSWHLGRVPAFVILDGTWRQTRRMFVRSPYLRGVPCLTLRPKVPSAYTLRRQVHSDYLSTVEVAIALLAQLGTTEASDILSAYFRVFIASCQAARQAHPLCEALPEIQQLLQYRRQHALSPLSPEGTGPAM